MSDDLAFYTTWGREFANALSPVAPGLCGQDGYEVLARAFGVEPSREAFMRLAERDFIRLRDAARTYLELTTIELSHIKEAVEATQFHWAERH
jgi:hypothetical protein